MTARYSIPVFLFFAGIFCQGQTRFIDSLKKNIAIQTDPAKKLAAVFALCEQKQSFHTDTLGHYAGLAKDLAMKSGDKAKIILADYFVSNCLLRKEQFDSALRITEKSLNGLTYKSDRDLYLKFSVQKGQIFIKSQRYKEALQQFYKILDEAELQGDDVTQANAKTNIGWVNMEMGQNKEALKWFYEALNSVRGPDIPDYSGIIYSNMAATYNELNQNDSAEFYIKKAIVVDRRSGKNPYFLANALAIQADIFIDTKRRSLAEASLNEALKIREQIGEPFYIVSDMTQLAIFYASNDQYDKGIRLCKEGIEMANQFGLAAKLPILYEALAENYKAAGMYKDYAGALKKIIDLKDSLYQKNSAKALAEIQGKYDLQKKENTIIQQKLDLTKKNYLLYGLLGLTIFTFILVYIIFRNHRRKEKLKVDIMFREEKRNAARAIVEAEENERKRISADLHDNLGVYAASIASNIDHILQNKTTLEDRLALEELRNNSRSIVSQLSDTIWALKKDALSLTAISDRLKLFIQRLGASYPAIKIDVIEKITNDHLLPPSQAFHLFQIMKEALNNALKHSGCKQIFVTIDSHANTQWKITIGDDGKGINSKPGLNGDGNGLLNMKNRSKEAGWRIEWHMNQPNGTSVIVEPVPN